MIGKTKLFALVVIASLLTISVAWYIVEKDALNNTGNVGEEITSVSDLVNASNEFTFDMYGELSNVSHENVFFSPYSITTALGMAYEGARGQTASEMESVLNFTKDNQTRWDTMQSYQSLLNAESSSYELSTANAYWLRQNEQLNDIYKNAIESYYLAHGEELDFRGDPEGSAQTINNWVEQETNGKIKDLLSPSNIEPETYLILTNAIYFKSDWKYQFDSDVTNNGTFNTSNGINIQTEMMNMFDEEIEFNYSSDDDVQFLQLPYKENDLSMYIILPKENDIGSIESKIDNEYLEGLKQDLSPKVVDIYLPKFKFEQKYELNKPLSDLGMPTAFSSGADFSGIKQSPTSEPLCISDVIHQSFVEVNEEGTEAAAATAVMAVELVIHEEPQYIYFNADHPFIFFIEHEETGQILFMGKVENPGV